MIPFAEEDHSPIGLGKEAQKVFQEPIQQRVDIESMAQVLGNLQDDLQLVRGILAEQSLIGGGGIDTGPDHLVRIGLLARTPRGRIATPAAYAHLGVPRAENALRFDDL